MLEEELEEEPEVDVELLEELEDELDEDDELLEELEEDVEPPFCDTAPEVVTLSVAPASLCTWLLASE